MAENQIRARSRFGLWVVDDRWCRKEGVMMKEATRPAGSRHAVTTLRTTQPHTNQPASCQPASPACATQTPHKTFADPTNECVASTALLQL